MIPKSIIFGLLLGVCWRDTYGSSYSNVYVQSGPNDPTEYATYGTPAVYTNSQFARLSGAPIGSIVPVASRPNILSPCVSPCVIPSQNFAAVAQLPVTNNARVLTYRAPNVPVVVAPSKDNGYEYSYVVYDENTGDQKAQRETSDGSVVRGEYSFVQPDGYVREVKYTADDLTGFNVVVRKILPDSVSSANKKPEAKEKSEPLPCVDVKKEALQVEPELPNNDLELNEVVVEPTTATTAAVVEDKTEAVTIPVPPPTVAIEVTQVPAKAPVPEQPQDPTTGTSEVIQAEVKEIANTQTTLQPNTNAWISYQDIVRCIQSRIQAQGLQNPSFSPLTYIVLPSNGKPC